MILLDFQLSIRNIEVEFVLLMKVAFQLWTLKTMILNLVLQKFQK